MMTSSPARIIRVLSILLAAAILAAPGQPQAHAGDWKMWGGTPDRNMVSDEKGMPHRWDVSSGENIRWKAPLGSQTYGNPVISDGKIFIGTNNNAHHRPGITGDKGVIVCLEETTGKVLWQATHDKLPTGRVNDWPEQGICSSPFVDGDRIYYVSNRAELVCADVEGFLDGENDGPFQDEKYRENEDADIVWVYDMIEELGVFPHNLATSSPVGAGDLIFLLTSNGVDEGHLDLPMPDAPAFIAVHKKTGELVWERSDPGENTLHGQWSSPTYGLVKGRPQVIFAGGDGWAYAYEPQGGELIWKFDLNPKVSEWKLGGRGTRNNIISTPVLYEDKVLLSVGQDPEHGEGPGHLYSIDATQTGEITEKGRIWHVGGENFRRSMSTVAIRDGLLYAADLTGFLYCLDLATGKRHWRYDMLAAVWGSPYLVDGKVYLGDEDGDVAVLEHGTTMKELAVNEMGDSVYTTAVATNGVLYITNRNALFAVADTAK
jgi:outer membrane protein assembly factor BamB